MALRTTTIGAFPKPEYVRLPDWFTIEDGPDSADPTEGWAAAMRAMGHEARSLIERGIRESVRLQIEAGIDIPTDGEIPRENYIHYHCRHLTGFDFDHLESKVLRGGTYTARLPVVRGAVRAREPFLVEDWRVAQQGVSNPVKITLPGPMTISDTVVDAFYGELQQFGAELADALNVEIKALAAAGCMHIQIDEPLFARKPDAALEYGMENVERAFHGVPDTVVRTMHMCCGYPDRLDNLDYPKAQQQAYFDLAACVDASSIQSVSLEDAHRYNDLSLLEKFEHTDVIFGAVAVALSRVETVEEIADRLTSALAHIDARRLWAAPDCGLGLLGRELAVTKLRNLCDAARQVG
ncbi:MAG: cobalamin-independent methionine synthase II family protein [Gammaproteobacteria bacterium]|nr:cobalamin-independent methionine synthase II family protein [Gammaproteobacteria bacterium]